jgi:hypothetical protein
VQGHRDYVIRVLLNGLTGPVGDKTYAEVMVPMGSNKDEWVAGIASYVRNSLGNSAGMVSPADVARVRAADAKRKTPWTVAELEATLPRQIDAEQLKVSASHAADAASAALTVRGWSSGAPQAPGMWFQAELAQPTMVAEVQFDSVGAGRGAAPPGRRGLGAPTAALAPPHGYSVQVSMDGTTWSKPIAIGKGEGARTDIAFTPTRAKFVRITQTDTVENAPNWSVSNFHLYAVSPETPAK